MKKTHLILSLVFVTITLLYSCKKDNQNSNNNDGNEEPQQPEVSFQIPPIDEYMPERLVSLFDSLNLLHRGEMPPTIAGHYKADSLFITLIKNVTESQWIYPTPAYLYYPYYFEFERQTNDTLKVIFKSPSSISDAFYICEFSDTDSTYLRLKNDLSFFTDNPLAPPYFKSDKFSAEDFRHAYLIGNNNSFTMYYYEFCNIHSNLQPYVFNSQPLNAIIISGKIIKNASGDLVINDFWYGKEVMKYFSEVQLNGQLPNPGDIIVYSNEGTLTLESFDE